MNEETAKKNIPSNSVAPKIEKDASVQEFVGWVNFNVMPLFILIFFFGMLIFFTFPQINNIFDGLNEIRQIDNTIKSKDKTIASLESLTTQQAENEALLVKMETLVPNRSTRVVEFKDTLVRIANEQGLQVTKSRAGEIITAEEEGFDISQTKPLSIIEIPVEISAQGTIDQFENFLIALYNSQDFFVVLDMEINKVGEENLWISEFTIVKYQFDGELTLVEDITIYTSKRASQDVIDFLDRKFGDTPDVTDTQTVQ